MLAPMLAPMLTPMASTCAAAALSLRGRQVMWQLTTACRQRRGGVGCDGYNTLRRACMLVRARTCRAAREDLNTARGGDLKLTTLGLLLPQLRDWGAWLLLGGFLAWRVRGCVHKVTISRSASLSGGNSGADSIIVNSTQARTGTRSFSKPFPELQPRCRHNKPLAA